MQIEDTESNRYMNKINGWKLKLDLKLVDAAMADNNFYLARKYLQSHVEKEREIGLYMAKMMFIKSTYEKVSENALTTMLKTIRMLIGEYK